MNLDEKMKNVDIRTVDKSTLTDIRDIKINTKKPVQERIKSYIEQVKNPYCLIVDGMVVKMTFANTEKTMNDRVKEYFQNKAEWKNNEFEIYVNCRKSLFRDRQINIFML